MSDDIATAPTQQKGRGAKTETQAAAPAQPVPGPFWHAPTVQARNALSTILSAAHDLDGLDDADDSSDAIRLIRVALDVVDDRFWIDDALPLHQRQNQVASYAFDVMALITGALHYPDQPFVFERRALLGHASAICDKLTDMHMSGPNGEAMVPELLEVIKVQPKPTHIPPPNVATSRTNAFSITEEYTAKQLQSVLETIAVRTNTMRQLMVMAQGPEDDAEAVYLEAAVIIATEVGSLADSFGDNMIVGDRIDWTFGPSFFEAGKAVTA